MAGALHHRGPDEFGIYRDREAGLATRACRSSTSPPASSRSQRGRNALGGRSTARSSTTSSCGRSCEALGHRFRTQQRHRGHRSRLRGLGRRTRSRASTASSRSRSGTRRETADAGARPRRRAAAVLLRARRAAVFRQRGEGDLRRRRDDAARVRSDRPRPDLHVLVGGRARARCSPASASSRPGHVLTIERGRGAEPPSGSRGSEAERRRAVRGHARRRGRGGPRRARARRPRCASCARTCRSAATSRAGSTARSSRRSAWRAKGDRLRTFSMRFEDAEYDETELPAGGGRAPRQRAPRDCRLAGATSPTCSPRWSATPSARSCAPRPRRCSCSRGWCATRASRSC